MSNNPQFTGVQPMQPRIIGHSVPPPTPLPPMSMQFRPVVPPPQQSFVPVASQQFQPGGQLNMGMPPHPLPIQYPQAVPTPPPPQIPGFPGHGLPQGPPPQPDYANRPVMSAPAPPQISNNFMPSFGRPGISHLSSSSGGQPHMNVESATQHRPLSQTDVHNFSAGGQSWFSALNQNMQSSLPPQQALEQPAGEQPWFPTGNQNIKPVTPFQQNVEQNVQSGMPSEQNEEQSVGVGRNTLPDAAEKASSDWREHTSREGKKYYYNKRTKVSSWEKPLELMTPTERADASTDWREFTTPEGRRYYFNKVTKISKWVIPNEVKLARDRVNMSLLEETPSIKDVNLNASVDVSVTVNEASNLHVNTLSLSTQQKVSSSVSATPAADPELHDPSAPSSIQEEAPNLKSDASGLDTPLETSRTITINTPEIISNNSPQEATHSVKTPISSLEEAQECAGDSGSGGNSAPEGRKADHGPLVYESKEEAKNTFKGLLEEANVGSDWNWDQAMRVIINDRRYGALRTLGERKQAFNEFVGQKKKQEAEEKRARHKKARDDFKKMLEESEDLTSSTRWSKAISMFENDERFHAVERVKDREDLFEDHLEEIKKKERAKALEEQKRHRMEYLEFLKSCDFINASSQWRKVQNRLEADERCLRLEKIDRLEIFQEYVRDLEMEEEEQIKLRMEVQRKAERKNRDEFRKLMEEHIANGILNAKSHWRDYCMKVKDAPAYLAVSSNTSGSTAKDLFEDVKEDLGKLYLEDKEKIEDAIKNEKISLSTTWTMEDFKDALTKEISSKNISDISLKLVFDELMEIAKEKEEKEAKKRKRLAEDIYEFLLTSKEITSSSKWEDCKPLVEERFIGEESFFQQIFDKVILELKEKAKQKERRRKEDKARKEKERKNREKEKERRNKKGGAGNRKGKERHKRDETESDESVSLGVEEKSRSRGRDKKHRKRHRDSFDYSSLDDDEKEQSHSHRHHADSKKSKQKEKQSWTSSADSESQSKRHKRDRWDGSNKKDDKDGEFGEARE